MRLPVQELMNMYKNNVYAAAFSICKNASDAEDVVQETFLKYYIHTKILMTSSIFAHGYSEWQSIKPKIFRHLSGTGMECHWKTI